MLASLRRANPNAAIDWLVQDTFAEAIAAHPALSGIVPFPRRELARWASPAGIRRVWEFLRSLRDRNYDLVLDCQGLARSGLFALATGAPHRVGLADAAELGWLGLTEHVHGVSGRHTVDRMLAISAAAGAPPVYDLRLYSAAANRAWAQAIPELNDQPFVVFAPTSRWPGKLWPGDRYAELAARLLDAGSGSIRRIAFVGSASEQDQCRELTALAERDARVVNLLGKTSIGRLMALIERAALVVANDSAALHIAVGFDRPLIGLFGPTRTELVGPYRRDRDVIQHIRPEDRLDHKDAAAGEALMARITTEEVLTRSVELLLSSGAKAPDCSSSPAKVSTGP